MTVVSTANRVAYVGNGGTTVFAVPFKYLSSSDISAYLDGVKQYSGFSVSAGGETGSVTFASAPSMNVQVVLVREQPYTQDTVIAPNGPFPAKTVERMADKAMIAAQQTLDTIGLAMRGNAGDPAVLNPLPFAAQRLDKLLSFDVATGQPAVTTFTMTQVAAVVAAIYTAAAGPLDALSFLQAGTGAVARTAQNKDRDIVSVKDFGAKGDGVTDDTAAIQAALNYAGVLVGGYTPVGANSEPGGMTVTAPAGTFCISDTLVVPPGVSLVGAGFMSTVFKNTTTNKTLIQTALLPGVYSVYGVRLAHFALLGAKTSAAQWGIDTLRATFCTFENIYIKSCGAGGRRHRQSLCCVFTNVVTTDCNGHGVWYGGGVTSWTDSTPNIYSSFSNTSSNCVNEYNEGTGTYLDALCGGNTFTDDVNQYNYTTANAGLGKVGFNIESYSTSDVFNTFNSLWTEGPCDTHVKHNGAGGGLFLNNWKHFPNGPTGYVNRALVCVAGKVVVNRPNPNIYVYADIAGSRSPYRCTPATSGIVILVDAGVTANYPDFSQLIEDPTGIYTGLNGYAVQVGNGYVRNQPMSLVADSTVAKVFGVTHTGDAYPWVSLDNQLGYLQFGSGAANPDCFVSRRAANVLQVEHSHFAVGWVGYGLRVAEGANAKQGQAFLVAGTVTVANTAVTASSRILLTPNSDGGTPGWVRVSTRVPGTSFTITSSSATDTSSVAYQIFEPA